MKSTHETTRVAGVAMAALAAVSGLVTVACSHSDVTERAGIEVRAPRALGPRGGAARTGGSGPVIQPIDLTREFTPVWGEAPMTVFDSRLVQPQVQVTGPWQGKVEDIEEWLEEHNEHLEASEEMLRDRRRDGEPNLLPVGEVTGERRVRPRALFPGIQQTPWQPPDCTLAVGRNYILETVNMALAWYTRSGTQVFSVNLDNSGDPGFFETVGGQSFCFDPKCFYDHIDNRYVIVALEYYTNPQSAWIDLAVSDDDDPNGVWYKYRTNAVVTVGANTYWVDYPGFGYDKDAYYVNGNLFGLNNGGFGGILFRTFKKPPLLGGQTAVYVDNRDGNAGSSQAAVHFGANQAAYFVSTESSSQMRIHAIKNAATTPTLVSTVVNVPSFGYAAANAPTPGGGQLDVIDDRPFNAVWRDGDLYFAHNSYSSSKNICRWYHLNTNNWPTSGGVTSVEAGNINPGGDVHSFFPAICVDKCKNVGVVLGTSSLLQNPDIRVTGRITSDPPGTMGALSTVYSGPSSTNGRWGDYFGMVIDPTDLYTFWYVGEYKNASGWGTYIGSFSIGCHADYDCNGFVNGDDFDSFMADFDAGSTSADYDNNGFVNGDDFDFFTVDFDAGC